ncbi:hypothetical protein F6455_17125 [Proteobacteria bacterium 005FR1]|nr:hypothetical protein [Proteobacteria bacterium 005FR1]
MSRVIRTCIACFSLFFLSQIALGATEAEERQRLETMQQSLRNQQADIGQMREELATYPDKISAVEAELRKAQEELAAEERALESLKANAGDPSADREIPIKEHAVRMSQRRVRSETRMLERYQRYRDDLLEEIAKAEQDTAQLKQRITAQNRRIAQAREEAERAAQAATAAASAPTPKPQQEQLPEVVPEPEVEEQLAAAEPRAEQMSKTASEETPVLSPEDYQAFETARSAMQRTEEAVSRNPRSNPRFSNLLLTGSDIEDAPFTHLGADQYRTEVVLPSGRQRFRIDSLRFRATISAENAGETYVFLVDASDRSQLKAAYFKKQLLSYLDQEPVLASATTAPKPEELEKVTLASGKTVQLSEDDAYALEIAREHMALLKEFQEGAGTSTPSFSSLALSGNMIEKEAEFKHLGQDQYQAEVKVQSGRQTIRINRSSFRIDIPDADEGETYLFYVDATRPSRLQLTYFKKAILDYL